jgi:uncharacterized protein with von Willebrand factor type A (vWA) domain
VFELVFERFFFRAVEPQAVRLECRAGSPAAASTSSTSTRCAPDRRSAEDGSRGAARPRAAGDRGLRQGRGLGRDRRRRPAHPPRARPAHRAPARPAEDDPRRDGPAARCSCAASSSTCGASSSAGRSSAPALPPARPLTDLDRALPGGPAPGPRAVHRVVAQLRGGWPRRARAPRAPPPRPRRRARTMRASLQTGGVPVELKYRPRARGARRSTCCATSPPASPRLGVLPVGAARAARLVPQDALVRVHRAHLRGHRHLRARAQLPRRRERGRRDAGVADISGYTDYGRVWTEFLALIEDELHPRATVIVLGDARTNGRPPRETCSRRSPPRPAARSG